MITSQGNILVIQSKVLFCKKLQLNKSYMRSSASEMSKYRLICRKINYVY